MVLKQNTEKQGLYMVFETNGHAVIISAFIVNHLFSLLIERVSCLFHSILKTTAFHSLAFELQ